MSRTPDMNVFKTRASKSEALKDATSRAAAQIMNIELAERIAKTKRLRAERLKHEAAQPQPELTPKSRKRN